MVTYISKKVQRCLSFIMITEDGWTAFWIKHWNCHLLSEHTSFLDRKHTVSKVHVLGGGEGFLHFKEVLPYRIFMLFKVWELLTWCRLLFSSSCNCEPSLADFGTLGFHSRTASQWAGSVPPGAQVQLHKPGLSSINPQHLWLYQS